jgi:peptidoglycan/xylan/chitin deacetylase (PgdA/CDA1 family)
MRNPFTQLGFITIILVLLLGCSSTGGKYGNSGNTAYLDGEGKGRGLFGGRKRKKSAPLQNPNINIRVDPNLARSLTYSRVKTDGPFIAMTFDDGPHPVHTPRLLDILKRRNIRATFFVVGTNARRYPQLIRRIIAEGHEIGNHTVNHKYLSRISVEQARAEVLGCEKAIVAACGVKPRILRPPGGHINDRVKVWLKKEFGYSTIMWAVDPEDWKRPGSDVVAHRIISETDPGEIVLAHDIHGPTIAAMPRALDGLLANGYRFVTVSQLIAIERRSIASRPSYDDNLLSSSIYLNGQKQVR